MGLSIPVFLLGLVCIISVVSHPWFLGKDCYKTTYPFCEDEFGKTRCCNTAIYPGGSLQTVFYRKHSEIMCAGGGSLSAVFIVGVPLSSQHNLNVMQLPLAAGASVDIK